MTLKAHLKSLLRGMQRENPELAQAVQKWSSFLLHAVEAAAQVTDLPPEDILQDIMLGICKVRDMYAKPLWRYEGHLYEIVASNGQVALIQTLKHNTKFKRSLWVNFADLKQVRLGKIESRVYSEIHQQYVDLLTAFFTAKRGFVVDSVEQRLVLVRSGPRRNCTRYKKVKNIRKVVHLVDIDVPVNKEVVDLTIYPSSREIQEYLADSRQTPEKSVISDEIICSVGGSLSPEGLLVLGCLIDDPGVTDWMVSRSVGLSHLQVAEARQEITKRYVEVMGLDAQERNVDACS
jgi:hypothetical protein